jgi:lysophospholipase L1-like esterase
MAGRKNLKTLSRLAGLAALALASACSAQNVEPIASLPEGAKPLPVNVSGRVLPIRENGATEYQRQWPGTYFETGFSGTDIAFRVGAGDVSLRIRLDGGQPSALVKPAPGYYRLTGLAPGPHRLRVDVVSESQSGPTRFGGFYAGPGTNPLLLSIPGRQIEFVGDSHTVGYGNTSPKRDCSQDEVWAATDTSQGIAPLTAGHYGASYEVNAISGRGIVRNYNGFPADTLPQAYPYLLFDKSVRDQNGSWKPQLIVIALGTNDFSTPLNPGEKWKTRDALHEDYEATYVHFVRDLRAANPHAYFLLWATDLANGEIATEAGKVVETLHRAGEQRVAFVPVRGLAFSACHFHPSVGDDHLIATALTGFVDAHPEIWR